MPALRPITHEYRLACCTDHAFETYAGRISEWWDPRCTANPETHLGITIEPRVGGRVYATHTDLGELDWGEVTGWEPGHRLVHTFTLAQDPEHPSEVDVSFEPGDAGCVVRHAHGGWTEENVSDRKKFGDWPILLHRFAALAQTPSSRGRAGAF